MTLDADLHITKKNLVAALFFSPEMVENLQATVGFTFAKNALDAGEDDDIYWAIDARARYAIDKAMSAGIYLNYSNADLGDDTDAIGVLDTVLNFTYGINDLVKVFVEGEFVFLNNSDYSDLCGNELAAQLGAIFTAGKGAEIDVAARLAMAGIGADKEVVGDKDINGLSFSIPVCMRIKM